MTIQQATRISLELRDNEAAMRMAQQIADLYGKTVRVVDEAGRNVGRAEPCIRRLRP